TSRRLRPSIRGRSGDAGTGAPAAADLRELSRVLSLLPRPAQPPDLAPPARLRHAARARGRPRRAGHRTLGVAPRRAARRPSSGLGGALLLRAQRAGHLQSSPLQPARGPVAPRRGAHRPHALVAPSPTLTPMSPAAIDRVFERRLSAFLNAGQPQLLQGGRKGVEQESLRVTPPGRRAGTPHPRALGSALTDEHITTDYSEALIELVTPAFRSEERRVGKECGGRGTTTL